jgi:UDP-N-acetylglucosamine transferase subunit ALG13
MAGHYFRYGDAMIFVSLGNLKQPFPRLLFAVDNAIRAGVFGTEEFLVQAGGSFDVPIEFGMKVVVLGQGEYIAAMHKAAAVICHCGAGTLFHAFQAGHMPLVMARSPAHGESIEDQGELMRLLASQGRVIPFSDAGDLSVGFPRAKRSRGARARNVQGNMLVAMVGEVIREFMRDDYTVLDSRNETA